MRHKNNCNCFRNTSAVQEHGRKPVRWKSSFKPTGSGFRDRLNEDGLVLTKVHELLGRQGIVTSYAALYRVRTQVVRVWTIFNNRASTRNGPR